MRNRRNSYRKRNILQILDSIRALQDWRKQQAELAFVPTMGNLHAGHLSLVAAAKDIAPSVLVSIFVNPLQFGANEDLANYPRTLAADCAALEAAGVDAVFIPSTAMLYPAEQTLFVTPPPFANRLCGASRAGHFQGVATVVAKLFNLTQPQFALFGQKDYQQLAVIRALVNQLNFPIQIIGRPTKRANDGLALSSRNGYLTADERAAAPLLYQTLQMLDAALRAGQTDYRHLEKQAVQILQQQDWQVDYIEIIDPISFNPLPDGVVSEQLVILAAAKLGKTRLIDNIEVCISKQ